MTSRDDSLVNLVTQVKQAVEGAQAVLNEQKIQISQVLLQLKTTAQQKGEGGIGFKFEPLQIDVGVSGGISQGDIQTISMTLVPGRPKRLELESTAEEELIEAMQAIARAVEQAAQSQPFFSLKEATVELNFGVTKEGKAKFSIFSGVEGKVSQEAVQTVKLTLKGPGALG